MKKPYPTESPSRREPVARAPRARPLLGFQKENARERQGDVVPPLSTEDADSNGSLSRDPSDPAVDRGRQAPNYEGDDENDVGERLVSEGVEEADTDQRRAARKRPPPG